MAQTESKSKWGSFKKNASEGALRRHVSLTVCLWASLDVQNASIWVALTTTTTPFAVGQLDSHLLESLLDNFSWNQQSYDILGQSPNCFSLLFCLATQDRALQVNDAKSVLAIPLYEGRETLGCKTMRRQHVSLCCHAHRNLCDKIRR